MFLDQYKKHRKRVGTLEMKSLKQIWQWIAQQLSRDLGVTVQASHCENMRKALERNYKKHVDHQHSTGRGRRTFDFFEEMEEISGKKRAIHPHFLLGINVVPEDEEVKNTANEGTLHIKKEPTTSYAVQPAVNEQTTSGSAKRKADNKLEVPRRTTKKRQSVLESMSDLIDVTNFLLFRFLGRTVEHHGRKGGHVTCGSVGLKVRVRVLSVLVTNWVLQPQSWPVGSIDDRYVGLGHQRTSIVLLGRTFCHFATLRRLSTRLQVGYGRHHHAEHHHVKADHHLRLSSFAPPPPPPPPPPGDPIGALLLHPIGAPLLHPIGFWSLAWERLIVPDVERRPPRGGSTSNRRAPPIDDFISQRRTADTLHCCTAWRWNENRREEIAANLQSTLISWRGLAVEELMGLIAQVCDRSLKRPRTQQGRRAVYWWTQEVAKHRRELQRARCDLQRANRRNRFDEQLTDRLIAEFKEAKEIERDPWGKAYRIVTKKMGPKTPLTAQHTRRRRIPPVATCTPFTVEELKAAAERLRTGKAPGPDGVPPEVVKLAVTTAPEEILQVMNGLFRDGYFPEPWKVGRLVLIPKKETDGEGRPKVRPICLLDAMGKIYEHLIRARLLTEVEEKGGLSDRQFGFREGMSTMDAIDDVLGFAQVAQSSSWGRKDMCALITLDVENAFNTVPWEGIAEAVETVAISTELRTVIASYLDKRQLMGSILGPTLWNIFYNGALEMELPLGCRTVAFADDLAVLSMGRCEEELMTVTNDTLSRVAGWMDGASLRLALQKTEAVLLVGNRRTKDVKFVVAGAEADVLLIERTVRCKKDRGRRSGTRKDDAQPKRGTKPHQEATNVGSHFNPAIRSGDMGTTSEVQKRSKRADENPKAGRASNSRSLPHRVGGGLAGPRRSSARFTSDTGEKRQKEESGPQQIGGAEKIYSDLAESMVQREHGEVGFYLAQALTGHGCFGAFLHRIGKKPTPACWYCGEEVEDDAQHTLFECPRWDMERLQAAKTTSRWPEEDEFVNTMLASAAGWNAMNEMCQEILRQKEGDERRLEARETVAKWQP
ncbi:hypothetical protein GEV33_004319 [Tenebrio molitor]|uniref:Reverse transcriptase domain-containing protein n=1 Tax=Tenebrio molitor TaxID=7067 RepID=A0A8J6HQD7_TENMO|nr:hypothetical protein GEV33_004319 [Tenebrio molitor]